VVIGGVAGWSAALIVEGLEFSSACCGGDAGHNNVPDKEKLP